MFDIVTLRLIWWILLGVLFIGFAVTDGFDLGTAVLFPFVARKEIEKRIVLNALAPIWEGNQVWLILAAGSLFAAWPYVYAVAFSGTYFIVLLLLLTMGILRPVSFKYRSKVKHVIWRRYWDRLVFIGGFVPAIIFGMLVGNILQGLPFYFDETLRIVYQGSMLDLFNPFALWCGATSLAMLSMHGGLFLMNKTTSPIRDRAASYTKIAAIFLILLFAGGGFWIAYGIEGYHVISTIDPASYSNPLNKQVSIQTGGWLTNYSIYPLAKILPLLGFIGALGVLFFLSFKQRRLAFFSSALSIIGIIGTVGVSMFPFILPSSLQYASSLLVWDASSSKLTLLIMLFTAIFFLPIILLYTGWVYYVLRGEVKRDIIDNDEKHTAY